MALCYPIIKWSDLNHTKKGVTNLLYQSQSKKDTKTELTSDAIKYLVTCFGYAVAQNKGDVVKVQNAVRNIPYHAFNIHDACGDWYGFIKDPINYRHRTIPGGFTSGTLFEELKTIFLKLSENAEKFASAASSQVNESFNHTMSSKSPKAICYSLSESCDYRLACSVGQKNLGNSYLVTVLEKLNINPGTYLCFEADKQALMYKKRSENITKPEFKKNRRILQAKRSKLKKKADDSEPVLYESNMMLLDANSNNMELKEKTSSFANVEIVDFEMNESNVCDVAIVYFDLETSDFSHNCDILQIALKYKDSVFQTYIKSTKPIKEKASEVNGLTLHQGQLCFHGKPVSVVPILIAIDQVLTFLTELKRPCLLVAHNCFKFDAPRLIRNVCYVNLLTEYSKVLIGFADSYKLLVKKFPKSLKGDLKLTTPAQELNLPTEGAHDAYFDVVLLEKICNHHFTPAEIVASKITVNDVLKSLRSIDWSKKYSAGYQLMQKQKVITSHCINRLAEAGISYTDLLNTYRHSEEEAIQLVKQSQNGKATLIKKKGIISSIMDFLRNHK